jgi:hypothetical protein
MHFFKKKNNYNKNLKFKLLLKIFKKKKLNINKFNFLNKKSIGLKYYKKEWYLTFLNKNLKFIKFKNLILNSLILKKKIKIIKKYLVR